MSGRTPAGSRLRAALPCAAGLVSLPAAGWAALPDGGLAEATRIGAAALASPQSAVALLAAGLFLGLVGEGARGAAAVGLAAAAAGAAVGLAVGAPLHLGALIAGAGGAIALMIVLGVRPPGAARAGLAVVAALIGFGFGARAGTGGAAAAGLAYGLVGLAGAAAAVAGGAALGQALRGRRVARGLGAWVVAMAILVGANGVLQRGPGAGAGLRVGSGALAEEEVPDLVRSLLEHVYFAFEKQDEAEIYDALAAVTSEAVLAELYLQKRAALALQEDGRSSDVQAVELERTEVEALGGAAGYRVHGVWSVRGSVIHWGHVHERVNRYEADLAIVPVDGAWKIGAFELIDVVRQEPPE